MNDKELIEKLSLDSVMLDEIISVVRGWNRDMQRGGHVPMLRIAKIVEGYEP